MSLQKFFSIITLFGIFLIGTILIIGMVSSKDFIYAFTPFIVIISLLSFLIVKDYLENISDKILLCSLLILLSLAFTFTASGFKDYSDALQNNNPLIKAQLEQNIALQDLNNYNMAVADSLKSTLEQYDSNAIELNKQLTTLISTQNDINSNNILQKQEIIEEVIYEEPAIEPVAPVYNYERYEYGDDD